MISQAAQFCNWFKNKNIAKKFERYDLSDIYKKYDYYYLVKELNKSKINLFLKMFRKFNLINFLKINALIILPKKIILKFINNV